MRVAGSGDARQPVSWAFHVSIHSPSLAATVSAIVLGAASDKARWGIVLLRPP